MLRVKKNKNIPSFSLIPNTDKKSTSNHALWDETYPDILCLAKRKTGKTTVIYNILKHIVKKDDIVIFFCGQLYTDASYKQIVKELKSRGIRTILETSIYDKNGNSQLKELIKYLKKNNTSEWEELDMFSSLMDDEDEEEVDDPKSTLDDVDQDYVLIFDDISKELTHNNDIKELLKANRHMRATVIISTQSLNDLPPQCVNQMTYVLAFSKIPDDAKNSQLKKLYDTLSLKTPYKKFKEFYEYATAGSHDFLFIDVSNNTYRKNFDLELE